MTRLKDKWNQVLSYPNGGRPEYVDVVSVCMTREGVTGIVKRPNDTSLKVVRWRDTIWHVA